VDKSSLLAIIQQQVIDRSKFRPSRMSAPKATTSLARTELTHHNSNSLLQKEKAAEILSECKNHVLFLWGQV
jgi:hypothetical protein